MDGNISRRLEDNNNQEILAKLVDATAALMYYASYDNYVPKNNPYTKLNQSSIQLDTGKKARQTLNKILELKESQRIYKGKI